MASTSAAAAAAVASFSVSWLGRSGVRSGREGACNLHLVSVNVEVIEHPALKRVAHSAATSSFFGRSLVHSRGYILKRAAVGGTQRSVFVPMAQAASGGHAAGSASKTALVAISNGIEEMEAVIVIDVLRRAGVDVTVASVEASADVTASRKVKLVADTLVSDVGSKDGRFDLIVLPGGMPGAERLRDNETLKDLVLQQLQGGRDVAAICAAPVVAFQTWGLLSDVKATAHPAFSGKLGDQTSVSSRVVESGPIVTSRGPGTAFEFALALVRRLCGEDKIAEVAGPMVMLTDKVLDKDFVAGELSAKGKGKDSAVRVLVPIADGTEEMEAVIIIDVLRRAGADVVVASTSSELEIVASRKVRLAADVLLADVASAEDFDIIVLPGGMPGATNLRDSSVLDKMLREQNAEGKLIGAICAAPVVVLHSKGLISGAIKATAHPAFSDQLEDKSAVDARVVKDGNVITSRGPGTAFEFALSLVEALFGKDKAADVAGPMVLHDRVLALYAKENSVA